MSAAARTRRPGFSLIELLVIVVILGLLAAIAFLRMTQVTREANLSVLKGDVRAAAMAEQLHFEQHFEYVELDELSQFDTSDGVTLELTWRAQQGFAIVGTHVGLPDTECGVFFGPAEEDAAGPAETEGVVACE
jgi:prepilin-type N-terminal cleavage/methylation domain-containing protein